nr:hypothetical protein [Tanacetum cinerariifolium]
LIAWNPAISATGSVDARGGGKVVPQTDKGILDQVPHRQHSPSPFLYQNPSLELPRAPHLHPPPSSSVEPLLAPLPLLQVLPQDLPKGLLQAPPQDLPEGLLQAPPRELPGGLPQAPYQTR